MGIDPIKPTKPEAPKGEAVTTTAPSKSKEKGKIDPLALAFLFIMEFVQTKHNTVARQANQTESAADSQDMLIRDLSQYHYETVQTGEKPSSKTLSSMQMNNEEISSLINAKRDQINVLSQRNSINEANLQTTTQDVQQSVQEGGSLMQMLSQLANRIASI